MLGRLVLLFIVIPLADLTLLLALSKYIGWQTTIATVIVSGIIGAWLARRQSIQVLGKIREQLMRNQMPADLLTDGAMIMLAAGLLLTPGLITDTIGLTFLIPGCRRWYKTLIMKYLKRHVKIVMPPGSPLDPKTVDGQVTGSRTGDSDSFDDSPLPAIEGKVLGKKEPNSM